LQHAAWCMCPLAKAMETCISFHPRWAVLLPDLITLLSTRITDKEAHNNCANRNLTVASTMLCCENNRQTLCRWLIKKTCRPGRHCSFHKNLPQTGT